MIVYTEVARIISIVIRETVDFDLWFYLKIYLYKLFAKHQMFMITIRELISDRKQKVNYIFIEK